jgi:hypothetical protein
MKILIVQCRLSLPTIFKLNLYQGIVVLKTTGGLKGFACPGCWYSPGCNIRDRILHALTEPTSAVLILYFLGGILAGFMGILLIISDVGKSSTKPRR